MKVRVWLLVNVLLACAGPKAERPFTPLERATMALQGGKAKTALELLTPLRAQNPNDLSIARMWAEAHVKNGSQPAALAALGDQDTACAHYTRGLLLFSSAKDAGSAVKAFQLAVERNPSEAELHHRLGIALVESEHDEAARQSLEAALARSPDQASWRLPYAKVLHRLGRSKDAIAQLRSVVTGDCTPQEAATAKALMNSITDPFASFPKAARPKLDQALSWLQQADVPQQAMMELEEIAREFPDLGVVHSLLGLAAARVDDGGRAIEEFKRAIELSPDDGKAYLYLADFYSARQRGATAKELYEKALERNPTLEEAWFKIGDAALERREYENARRAFRTSSRLNPDSWPARGKLAAVLQLENNWPAADRELRGEIDLHPENLEAVLRMGLLHTEKYLHAKTELERQAARVEATKWLERLLEQQPENALASRALERVKQQR